MTVTLDRTASPPNPRVAIFCDDQAWGGIVTYCVMLARGLPEHGIDAVLVAPRAYPWHQDALQAGVQVVVPQPLPSAPPIALARTVISRLRAPFGVWYRSLTPRSFRWLLGAWTELLEIRRELSLIPADLIHVQSAGGEVAALAARFRKPRVPVVSTLHFPASMVAPHRRGSMAWRLVCGLNMRAADATIGVAGATLEDWRSYPGGSVAVERSRIIHNGTKENLAIPSRADARASLGLPIDATVLLNVAALLPYKDQHSLLVAVRILRDQGVDVTLLVAGEGPCREALLRDVAAFSLSDRVQFLGHRSDVATLVAATDLYVHSSLDEAFPMSLLEAGLQNVPIVATNVGGVGELITDGETGTLVAAGKPEELAGAIRAALADRTESARRANLLAARIRESFLSEHMLAQTAALYRELLRSRD